jgi:hypothetical protein
VQSRQEIPVVFIFGIHPHDVAGGSLPCNNNEGAPKWRPTIVDAELDGFVSLFGGANIVCPGHWIEIINR